MPRAPSTPFPFPDIPVPLPHFPPEPPLDATTAELAGWWLEVRCDCGAGGTKYLPFRLLAARLGWQVTLRNVVDRLKCNECGAPAASLVLVESAAGGPGTHSAKPGERLVIR